MSDCVDLPSASYPEEFRLLIWSIIQDELTTTQLETLHIYLDLPRRLSEPETLTPNSTFRILQDRNVLCSWSQNPGSLVHILQQWLRRDDLATRVQNWADEHRCESQPVQAQQETDQEYLNQGQESRRSKRKSLKRRPSIKRPDLEPVCEEETDKMLIRSQAESVLDDSKIPVTLSEAILRENNGRKDLNHSINSTASSGYFSDRSSKLSRSSELSFTGFSLSGDGALIDDDSPYLQFTPADVSENDSLTCVNELDSLRMNVTTESYHPVQVLKIESPSLLPTAFRPASPNASKKNSVASLERPSSNKDEALSQPFRARSGSLPEDAKLIRSQVNSRIHKGPVTSSTVSINSDTTIGSCYSSQQSLSSSDMSSEGSGSTRGSQESVKSDSLGRCMPIKCRTRISGEIKVPLKKILEDIAKGRNEARLSGPFPPSSKDVRYQLRFISSNFSKTACALYIDVARDYLKRYKHKAAVVIHTPNMDITVSVSVSSPGEHQCRVLEKQFKNVSHKFEFLSIQEYIKKQSNSYVMITSFPKLLPLEKLEEYQDRKQLDLTIQVDLEY